MANLLPLSLLCPSSSSSSSIHHSLSLSLPNLRFPTIPRLASAKMGPNEQEAEQPKLKDFPYAAAPIRDLMMELVSTVESRLDSQLLPCTLPQDVQYYRNRTSTAHGSLLLRSGAPSSPIDFILGSWLHSKLPNGGAVNITSLIAYMNESTDIPQFVVEFIQSSPTSLVLILDLPPRKDLLLNPDYIKTFYEDTNLDKHRQLLYGIPEAQPYISHSLYVRCVWSPTGTLIRVDTTEGGGEGRMEEILRGNVSQAAKEALDIWLELCSIGKTRGVDDDQEKAYLKKRDQLIKNTTIDIDLGSSLPNMFGKEIADRVLGVLRSI